MLSKESVSTVQPDVQSSRFEWCLGFLLGLPFAVPAPPMYVIGFACFLIAPLYSRTWRTSPGSRTELLVLAIVILALGSNAVGVIDGDIDALRVFTTSFFFVLFLFPAFITDTRSLFHGFCASMLIWALLVIIFAFQLGIFENGLLLFSMPEFRLWGSELFPDWPNYMAFLLMLACLVNILAFRRHWHALIICVAALLTTSRTPLIGLGLLIACVSIVGLFKVSREKFILMPIAILILTFSVYVLSDIQIDDNFLGRLLVFEDRDDTYSFALDLVQQAPWIGHGSILLDESIGFFGHASFHNSYLDIAVRHGLFALLVFLALLLPSRKEIKIGGVGFLVIYLYFVIGSLFQNFLKHPHIVMLFAAFLYSGRMFSNVR